VVHLLRGPKAQGGVMGGARTLYFLLAASAAALAINACTKTQMDHATTSTPAEGPGPIYQGQVIYGDDNRLDLYQVTNPEVLRLADSTVAMVERNQLSPAGQGRTRIQATAFGEVPLLQDSSQLLKLCSSEPFRDQPTGAYCSGSLVGPDIILTAGHCVRDESTNLPRNPSELKFIFGYDVRTPGANPDSVPTSEIYTGSQIIKQQVADADFAVVKLDRPVLGHQPLALHRSGSVNQGDEVLVIGHPVGLPTKVAGSGFVRASPSSGYFTASLDTYGGNSGSAVFNSHTGLVEGILVRGDEDFVQSGNCVVSNRCTQDGCRGEDVTRIGQVLAYLPASPDPSATPSPQPSPTKQPVIYAVEPKPAVKIPDNDLKGIQVSVMASQAPAERQVHVEVRIRHTYRGDLILKITAPDGQSVLLQKFSGRNAHDIVGVYGVSLASVESLSKLSSVKIPGKWILGVVDDAKLDVGTLERFAVRFE